MSSQEYSIYIKGLHKRYGKRTALHDLDLAVHPGTVHGLLGPNGAVRPPQYASCARC